MPIYEYECGKCGEVFEVMQSFSDDPVNKCASCGSKKVSRLLGKPALHFKGTGFYINDSKGSSSSTTSSTGESSSSESSAPTKKETASTTKKSD